MEEKPLRLTRHNGRSGKNGTYNPKHNDRRFDLENSEHIDAERAKRNIYWDCYRGITTSDSRNADAEQDFSFEKVEQMYYTANSHFLRPAGPHFPASQGHIKRSALEIGRARGAPPC